MTVPPLSSPWLVTGASGFLGRHLLEANERRDQPYPLLALVRDRAAWEGMSWTGSLTRVGLLTGSVTEPAAWSRDPRLEGLGGLLHLAALVRHSRRDAGHVLRTNVEGTLAMVRLAAARRCRMIFLSTSGTVACFRDPEQTADETAPYRDAEVSGWPYYRSKIEAERRARSLAAELGVELVIVRPPILLGPGDHRGRASGYVRRLLEGRLPFLIRGGMHFVDVRDVAAALLRLMALPEPRPVYHLPGTSYGIVDFYHEVAALAGVPKMPRVVPYRVAWLLAWLGDRLGQSRLPEPGLVEMASRYWGMRSSFAEADLGFRSRSGTDTLRDTIAWLREEGA